MNVASVDEKSGVKNIKAVGADFALTPLDGDYIALDFFWNAESHGKWSQVYTYDEIAEAVGYANRECIRMNTYNYSRPPIDL